MAQPKGGGIRALATSLTVVVGPCAVGDVIHVPGDTATVADAVELASEGDVIQLAPGVHTLPRSLAFGPESITLRGDPDAPHVTVLVPERTFTPCSLSAWLAPTDSLRIEGLTLRGLIQTSIVGGRLELHAVDLESDTRFELLPAFFGSQTVIEADDLVVAPGDAGWTGIGTGALFNLSYGALAITGADVDGLLSPLLDAQSSFVGMTSSTVRNLSAFEPIACSSGVLLVADTEWSAWTSPTSVRATESAVLMDGLVATALVGPLEFAGPFVSIANSTFQACGTFTGEAGVASIASNVLSIRGSSFLGNGPMDVGPGALLLSGAGSLVDCTFEANQTFGRGTLRVAGTFDVVGCEFIGNAAGDGGAGISATSGSLQIEHCGFYGNQCNDGVPGGGSFGGAGGALALDGCNAKIRDSSFRLNRAIATISKLARGGAIAAKGCDLTVERCRFDSNRALGEEPVGAAIGRGGAIHLDAVVAAVTDCAFLENEAKDEGGAVFASASSLLLMRVSANANVAGGPGGAIHVSGGTTTVADAILIDNLSGAATFPPGTKGGGVSGGGTILTSHICGNEPVDVAGMWEVDSSSVVGCNVVHVPSDAPTIQAGVDLATDGTVVLVGDGDFEEGVLIAGKSIVLASAGGLDATTIDGSSADGAVLAIVGPEASGTLVHGFTIRGGEVGQEYAPGLRGGGGVFVDGSSPAIRRCLIEANYAPVGGGVFARDSGLSLEDCTIRTNGSNGNGGGVHAMGGAVTVLRGLVTGNAAFGRGGGLHFLDGAPVVAETVCIDNSALLEGGGIASAFTAPFPTGEAAHVEASVIDDNKAASGGGIWIEPDNAPLDLIATRVCGNVGTQIAGDYTDFGDNALCACLGDLDANAVVGASDLMVLLGAWGPCLNCAPDLDADDDVDANDMALLISVWGPCDG
jgi:hypothetical protein